MKLFLGIMLGIFFANLGMASTSHGGQGADHSGVPIVVLYQAINVAIIFFGAFYFGRKKVSAFFVEKRKLFLDAQERAKSALRVAELEHHEVKTRLDKLKVTRSESLAKAKTDANDMRERILQDAHTLATKLKDEALLAAKIEVQRAKHQLKEQLVREAFETSKKDLSLKATSDDQKKLQEDFISKVQVVQ